VFSRLAEGDVSSPFGFQIPKRSASKQSSQISMPAPSPLAEEKVSEKRAEIRSRQDKDEEDDAAEEVGDDEDEQDDHEA
jgi:hypothetical protein